jgi:hypothetical protein
MGKISTFGVTVAAIGLIASPVSAQSSKPKNVPPVASTLAPAPATTRTTPVTAEDLAIARDIVQLYMPYDDYVADMQAFLNLDGSVFSAQSPEIQQLEAAYPGIVKLLIRRIGEWLLAEAPESYAQSLNVQADVFAQKLTREELLETRVFLQSDGGKGFLAITRDATQVDEQEISAFMGKHMDSQTKRKSVASTRPSDLYAVDDDALFDGIESLPEAAQDEIAIYFASPTAEKFLGAMEDAERAHVQLVEGNMAKDEKKMQALVMQVFTDYEKGVR